MKILFEGCKYQNLSDLLGGHFAKQVVDGKHKVCWVGYCWNDNLNDGRGDAVFILPKVLVFNPDEEKKNPAGTKTGKVFGEFAPVDLIDFDGLSGEAREKLDGKIKTKDGEKGRFKDFLLEFAIQTYRALSVFDKDGRSKSGENVIERPPSKQSVRGVTHVFDTKLDVILALLEFYRRNRDFVVFTAKRCHSGFNKVNWPKTVAKKTPIFQSPDEPVYVETENRKKRVDFEEELLVIFHSILHHVAKTWGFPVKFDLNYETIAGVRFKHYLDGYGAARLRAIKYRYFSDKLLELWELCYLFFEKHRKSARSTTPTEYLFARKFDVVFEAMIDELVGEPDLPKGLRDLKEQKDGKRADHIYFDQSLLGELSGIRVAEARNVCCIGDSKYYGINNEIGSESIAKQFTYAKNVIQWNVDNQDTRFPMLRDIIEGYDITPNFFVSAIGTKDGRLLDFDDDGMEKKVQHKTSLHFKDRLFDRDTLHLVYFNVNFFRILSLYARNQASGKSAWRENVRKKIRNGIVHTLFDKYVFYLLSPKIGQSSAKQFLHNNFWTIQGKVRSIGYANDNMNRYLLALDRNEQNKQEQNKILELLKGAFTIREISDGNVTPG